MFKLCLFYPDFLPRVEAWENNYCSLFIPDTNAVYKQLSLLAVLSLII